MAEPKPGRDVALDPVKELLLGLPGELALAAERGLPVVFVTDREPADHVRALMRTLGVRVEVRPVSPNASANPDGTVPARAFAAQDHRASIASVHRREQAGDQALTCGNCGTETDVTEIKHSPSCASYEPPAPAKKAGGGQGVSWENDRNGKRRSTRERNAAGELSAGEMSRRHEAVLDAHPTVTSCAFEGCEWRFEGGAAACREAAAQHRAAAHPAVGKGKRARFAKPGQSNPQIQAAVAVKAPAAPAPRPKARRLTPQNYWTDDRVLAAIRAHAEEHGRPPGADEWRRADPDLKRPTTDAVVKVFGKWSAAIVAAGFAKPVRGRPAKSSGPEPLAPRPPESEASGQASSGDRLASPWPADRTAELGSGSEIFERLAGDVDALRAEADRLNDVALEAGRKRDALEQLIESIERLAA